MISLFVTTIEQSAAATRTHPQELKVSVQNNGGIHMKAQCEGMILSVTIYLLSIQEYLQYVCHIERQSRVQLETVNLVFVQQHRLLPRPSSSVEQSLCKGVEFKVWFRESWICLSNDCRGSVLNFETTTNTTATTTMAIKFGRAKWWKGVALKDSQPLPSRKGRTHKESKG